MKKIIGMFIGASVLLSMMTISAFAYSLDSEIDATGLSDENTLEIKDDALIKEKKMILSKNSDNSYKEFKIKGIWGFSGDNESDGYFGAKITKRPNVLVLKGLYNKTGDDSYGKVFGIMKKGYFNGRIITPEGEKCHITGLYKFDLENNTIKMKWMTPHTSGWAGAKIVLNE